MIYALALGVLGHGIYLNQNRQAIHDPGLDWTIGPLLKVAIALMGIRITMVDIAALGWETAFLTVFLLTAALVAGWAIGRAFGLTSNQSILTAGAVAICGTTAAIAIAATMPKDDETECFTIVTVIGITILSTLAMALYPVIGTALSFSDVQNGLFFGTTIHNVAQAIGAGFVLSPEAADIAAIVKLMRVACLLPVLFFLGIYFRSNAIVKPKEAQNDNRKPPLPLFLVAFAGIVLLNSIVEIPPDIKSFISTLSYILLVMVVAALGLKTALKDVIEMGKTPALVMVSQTLFLAVIALAAVSFKFSV